MTIRTKILLHHLAHGRVTREDGQVIVMVGLAAIVLFGAIGLGIDVGRLYITKAEISRALASGVNTSYSSLDAWASKNAISFCLSWTLPMLMALPG